MNRVDKEERIQRIRIGLTGLAFVFLLVLLGTAISRSSNDAPPTAEQNEMFANQEPNEPLAEIGAAPGTGTSTNQADDQSNQAKDQ
ncbi:hypothetical protein LZ518_00175 [Sphingomonas sp. RB56-2]|uniref:Uncharacterized protein n=1 Tax=Sphingomonas brevis TaxID=2908206 RepID=A0ABT0S5F4_9SPHN|nr:hypothetical protein [Sphingomonas brevis]MCL6739558.1 hypothetical protein [Sphingomonas brevis]